MEVLRILVPVVVVFLTIGGISILLDRAANPDDPTR
jgi:hypothetical protein